MIARLPSPPPSPSASPSNAAYNKSLLSSGTFTDCTIHSGSRVWRAHRNILGPRCRFFSVCFDGRFREASASPSSSPSGATGNGVAEIRLDSDHPDAVAGLLEYLYTLEYPGPGPSSESEISDSSEGCFKTWIQHFRMHAIADKYDVPALSGLARQNLLDSAHSPDLRRTDVFQANLPGFAGFVEALYASDEPISDVAQELRVEIFSVVAETVARIVRDEGMVELMLETPEFAIDLVEALAKRAREREMQVELGVHGLGTEMKPRRVVHIPLNEDSDLECD